MLAFFKSFKFKAILIVILFIIVMILYSFFITDTVITRITDAQMTKVNGRFMIATESRPFVNEDAKYRFKFNSGDLQNEAIRLRGRTVRIKKYGWRITVFSMYENVVGIEEEK
jgi:LPS O-antigen subunit length determinant protein (WzzB/FepE family)